MSARLVALRWDAIEPAVIGRFWADALGWAIDDGDADDVRVAATDGTPFDLRFVRATEAKRTKNSVHLDLMTSSAQDRDELEARLRLLGAHDVDVGQLGDEGHVVLADPEGNELCVIEPTNSFLAGCGRVGSITCDGSSAVGRFWSAVLGWPLVWDQDEETAIRAPSGDGPFVTWGPPVPAPGHRHRLRLEIVTDDGPRLTELGAMRDGDALADPDGNRFDVLG